MDDRLLAARSRPSITYDKNGKGKVLTQERIERPTF